jgi:methyl-accepting chemotaxis protein
MVQNRFSSLPIAVKIVFVTAVSGVMAILVVAAALVGLRATAGDYRSLLERDRLLVDTARRMQVVFKIQVQEWKNILLRGRDDSDLTKYTKAFFERENEVAALAASLAEGVGDPAIAEAIQRFSANHAELGARYRGAMGLFEADRNDPYRADQSVRGMDREPTDQVDAIVADIETLVDLRSRDLDDRVRRSQLAMSFVALALVAASIAIALLVSRRISRRLATAAGELGKAAAGNLTVRLDARHSDEIGRISSAANELLEALEGAISEIVASSRDLATASDRLTDTANTLGAAAEETSNQAQVVAAAADQIAANVGSVATGTDEMSASIREIARNAAEAGAVAATAADHSRRARETIGRLESSGAEIGDVVRFIDTVADQTSLLALNATIEAARAGSAGKGFAVVADEVKNLARQTGGAIDGIKERVAAIQTDAEGSVAAMDEIAEIVAREHEIASTIASAVEQQTATTTEIGAGSSDAAAAASEIAASIASLAEGAAVASRGIHEIVEASRQLEGMTARLGERVGRFRVTDS